MTADGLNGRIIGVPNRSLPLIVNPGVWPINAVFENIVNEQWVGYSTFATGGTVQEVTLANSEVYRIHTFTSPGVFEITKIGSTMPNSVEYLVVGGGGGAGSTPVSPTAYGISVSRGGGGGAGGYRTGTFSATSLASNPITIGAGGAVGSNGSPTSMTIPGPSSIVSAGGGRGGTISAVGASGGSGGGPGGSAPVLTATAGNTPPVTPSQGNPSGDGSPGILGAAGGGGIGSAGSPGSPSNPTQGAGGSGTPNSITNTDYTYSIGGAAGSPGPAAPAPSPYGSGGTWYVATPSNAGYIPGGDGIVVLRYRIR